MGYTYVLNAEVLEVFAQANKRQREFYIKRLEALAANPFQQPDETSADSQGRTINHTSAGRWVFQWWPDHAVKEVRVVGMLRVQ